MVAHPFCKQTLKFSCQSCSLRQLCFPLGLTIQELSKLDTLIHQQSVLKKGATLFKQGSPFKGFFVVRSGSFKYVSQPPGADPSIIAFYMPGDFFGLDAIHNEQHPATAQALEDSSVCIISFDELMRLTREIPKLQQHLMNIVSQKCAQDINKLQRHHTAEQRLAQFLLNIAEQFERRGYAANEFQLSMSRKDIANYLDLADETISRLFKLFQDRGWLKTQHKVVTLQNIEQLTKLIAEPL